MRMSNSPRRRTGLVAAALSMALAGGTVSASAEDAGIKALFKSMSDYLAAQKTLSFDFDSSLELVSKEGQKVSFASSGAISLSRPDKIHVTRTGGFANVELIFDGKTLSLLGKNKNVYGQVDEPGTVDQLVDTIRDKYHRPLPGADLLLSDVNGALMPLVKDAKYLGTGFIGGIECDHLAFRQDDVDWQIWIATGDRPLPCRYEITSTQVAGFPQYRLDLRNWKAGGDVAAGDFSFKPPADAKKLDLADLADTDEIPDIAKGALK